LVLDDLTSALDPATTEFVLKETICRVLKGKTLIMSTNDMSILKYADYIYYMEDGKILKHGNFESIRQTELWKKQQELLDEIDAQKKYEGSSVNIDSKLPNLVLNKEKSIAVKPETESSIAPQKKIQPIMFLGLDLGLYIYLFKQMGGLTSLAIIVFIMSVGNLMSDY